MRVLIATAKFPKNFHAFAKIIRDSASEEGGLVIPQGMLWTTGPGCTNLAFDCIGEDSKVENFVNQLTMLLMPAKWSTTSDELPQVDTCDVEESVKAE